MPEIKKHIESQMKLLATERIKQLLEKVQTGGFQTRALEYLEVFPSDVSELCNWCRLYFGEGMRPHFEPNLEEGIELLKEAKAELLLSENLLKEKNPLVEVKLDESTDDDFKGRVRNKVETREEAPPDGTILGEAPVDGTILPWRDLNVEQAAAARNLVSKVLKVNPTIRDLAMHNYVVKDGAVRGLEFNANGGMESML